ncbi:MAG: hypothetical protein LBT13_03425 [Treponema sp.]|nr:hypothetical protein [Treponema sp.]
MAAKERAEALIKTGSFRFETDTARASLIRAEFRIKARDLGKRQSG